MFCIRGDTGNVQERGLNKTDAKKYYKIAEETDLSLLICKQAKIVKLKGMLI